MNDWNAPDPTTASPLPPPAPESTTRKIWAWFLGLTPRGKALVIGGIAVLMVIGALMGDPEPSTPRPAASTGSGSYSTPTTTSSEPELQACPDYLETLAERNGGGFLRGVDSLYDPTMDWDGDGVSCE